MTRGSVGGSPQDPPRMERAKGIIIKIRMAWAS